MMMMMMMIVVVVVVVNKRHLLREDSLLRAQVVKVKLPLCFLTDHHAMKAYWGVEV
jgi:hypothetical protein